MDPTVKLETLQTREEHGKSEIESGVNMVRTLIILDCQFGAWEEASCSATCGSGVKVLSREIIQEARGHGACDGETEVLSPCNTEPCPEHLDCQWADWTESDCSASCGGGTLTRSRTRLSNNTGLGLNCTGETTQLEGCNQHICPSVWAAVLISLLLRLLLAFLFISFIYCGRKYRVDHTPVSFNMPIIKVRN